MQCAREEYPAAIKKDCSEAISDLNKTMPSVVFRAKDSSGNDVLDVFVEMDGTPLVDHLDGSPVLVDPGPHELTFERGKRKVTHTVLVGERDRPIVMTFEDDTPSKATPAVTTDEAAPFADGSASASWGSPSASWNSSAALESRATTARKRKPVRKTVCTVNSSGAVSDVSAVQLQPCHVTDSSGLTYSDRANRQYLLMGAFGGVGLVLARVGTGLVVSSFGPSPPSSKSVTVVPIVSPKLFGAGLTARF